MHPYEDYKNCNELFLINDPFFQDSILKPTSESTNFWNRFLEIHPEKKETVESARTFLQGLTVEEKEPDEALVEASLKQHLAFIAAHEERNRPKIAFLRPWVIRVAAIFIPAILLCIVLFNNREKQLLVSTGFGKTDTVALPDQSLVILNANSSIKYPKSFNKQEQREIWLDGEAFFDVNHLNNDKTNVKEGERFIVHTEHLDIEVLGTQFNVRHRRGRTEIVLQSGSIRVIPKTEKAHAALLTPGEMLSFDEATNEFDKMKVDAEKYSAWKEKKLILNNPTVNEIIYYLEDNFGKKIVLENREMGSIKVVGPIRIDNVDDALFILSTVLVAEVKEKKDGYIIRKR